jgi:CRISPR-associated protein Cmr6
MTNIVKADKVPMMFRAQVEGRCQLQRIDPKRRGYEKQDVQIWTEQWIDKAEEHPPAFGSEVQSRPYQITWRFITNGGQDDGIIRPVIGARGIPFYSGSSMKGLFRRAAQQLEQTQEIEKGSCDRLCGDPTTLSPGLLRFHGGYPTSDQWTEGLVDIIHPQKAWQVQESNTRQKSGGAFAQISLFKPELKFGISSTTKLIDSEWETIWGIWETALSMGIARHAV